MTSLALPVFWTLSLVSGLLLFRRMRGVAPVAVAGSGTTVSLIIPARNEERNLKVLLASVRACGQQPTEVLVMDDDSSDGTAAVARSFGATVIRSKPLPEGFRGKPWACQQGAEAAQGGVLLFLDADTYLMPQGFARLLSGYEACTAETAYSVLPFHAMQQPYEQLSLFFNLLTAAGAGGFSGLSEPLLFGQSMMIGRELYLRAGGHLAVKGHVLENLHFAACVRAVGGSTMTAVGQGALHMRMFPEGFGELLASWKKAFVTGASATSVPVLVLSIVWLSGGVGAFITLLTGHWRAAVFAAAFALETFWFGRKLGTFRWESAVLYPVPLVFYFVVFAQSAWLRATRGTVSWKGRSV